MHIANSWAVIDRPYRTRQQHIYKVAVRVAFSCKLPRLSVKIGNTPKLPEVSMRHISLSLLLVFLLLPASCRSGRQKQADAKRFNIMETTIEGVQAAYKSGQLTARQLVQMYLDRIEAYDQKGPAINSI